MEIIARHQLLVAAIAVVVALVIGMPTLFTYIATQRREKRQNRVRDVLRECGPTYEGDFMFRCPQLTQGQRDKALLELKRSGEIIGYADVDGRVIYSFPIPPRSR